MPEPQPGADRPVDGSLPDSHRDGEPAVNQGQEPAPESPAVGPGTGPGGTRELPEPAAPQAAPPRWSGSAAVPPAPPRRHGWGESAEPTPPPVTPPPEPEHQTPVDPWAGVDTSGWELPSADFPALPPTLSYPVPPATRPYAGPTAPPVSPAPQVSPAPYQQPPGRYPTPTPWPTPVSPAPPAHPPQAHPAPPPNPAGPTTPPSSRGLGQKKSGPVAPPPGWQAPAGNAPAAKRRRRRWPWLLLLTLVCCCGCPAYYGMPMASQYPANAALPEHVADLRLHEDPRSTQNARQLENQMRQAHLLAEDTFAGIYTASNGKRVTVVGGTGFRFTPAADADAEMQRLTDQYALVETKVVETGVRGRHERCAVGHADGIGVVVCISVDHGSLTSAVFTGLSVDDSARLLGILREQILTTGG
ncbi:hypothetical protein [Micromonospora sp. LOL_024]|uniref:hypothetical protein n=1 Tax=Micromonospora sp. LOL_024 TaxID=3345412 RepID=UPI003A88890A